LNFEFRICLGFQVSCLHVYQEAALRLVVHVDRGHAVLLHARARALAGVEMVLSGRAGKDLAVLGDLEALLIGFGGFDAHNIDRIVI